MACRLLTTRLRKSFKPTFTSTLTTLVHDIELTRSKTFFDSPDENVWQQVSDSMFIVPDFVSPAEEQTLLEETEKIIKRIRYEQSHWDDAIHNYRETEHLRWTQPNQLIIDRVRNLAFKTKKNLIKYVHILDIAKDGFIKPHVDSIRVRSYLDSKINQSLNLFIFQFCGDTIAGMSLMSDSVMRLALEKDKSLYVDVLLNRRSLYIMT